MIAIVTKLRDDRPLYKRDILNACCQAPGSFVRFAYRENWIRPSLRSTDAMTGKDALLFFCEQTSATQWDYHLVRRVRIAEVLKLGSTSTLRLELREFPKYEGRLDLMKERLAKYVTTNGTEWPQPNNTAALFVTEGKNWEEPDDFCNQWRPLAEYLSSLTGLDDSVFLAVQDKKATTEDTVELLAAARKSSSFMEDSVIEVDNGSDWKISVRVVYGHRAATRSVALVVNSDLASVVGPLSTQSSGGETAEFFLAFKKSLETVLTTVVLKASGPSPGCFSPELVRVVRVVVPPASIWVTSLLVTAGPAISSITAENVESAFPGGWLNAHSDAISWFAKVVGAILLFIGASRGFSKLPLKGK